jgi:hypothetical protein
MKLPRHIWWIILTCGESVVFVALVAPPAAATRLVAFVVVMGFTVACGSESVNGR